MSATGSVPTSTFMAGDGSGYERQMGRWSRRLAPMFVDFAGISEGEHVLDVGCGTGSLAFTLSQNPNVKNINAIDYSPIYVEHAKRLNKDPRVQFQVGDACARCHSRMPPLITARRSWFWPSFLKRTSPCARCDA